MPAGFTPLTLVVTFEKLKYMRPETEVELHHLPLEKLASSLFTAAGTALVAAFAASEAAVLRGGSSGLRLQRPGSRRC